MAQSRGCPENPPPKQPLFRRMGMPRRIAVKGMQGVDVTVSRSGLFGERGLGDPRAAGQG
jgi:hypothetical protein